MRGVKKIEYLTKKRGVGAETHWIIETGGNEIEWEAENTEWIENEKAGWHSTSGMKNSGYWLLDPIETGTKVTLVMDYELPYSIIGKIIDKLKVEKEFTKQVDESLEAVKRIIESEAQA